MTKNPFFSALHRIKMLIKLQMAQKYTYAINKTKFIINLVVRLLFAVATVFIISYVMKYFNFSVGLTYDKDFLAFIIFLFFITELFSAIFNTRSQLFKSTDNEFLFATPVKNEEVFISKLFFVIYNEVLSSLFILLPVLIGFKFGADGCYVGLNFISTGNYYFFAIMLTLLLPLIAVGLAVLISIPYNLYKNAISGNTVLVILDYSVLFGIAILLFQFIIKAVLNVMKYLQQSAVIAKNIKLFLLKFADRTFIFRWTSLMFMNYGSAIRLLIIVLVAVALMVLGYFAMRPLYFKMCLGQSNGKTKSQQGKKVEVNSPQKSIMKKDISMLVENGGDFTKYFSLAFVMPFILVLINQIFTVNEISLKGKFLMLATNILVISMFTCMNSSYISSALTMEGPNYYIFQTTPVSAKKQLFSKFMINFIVNAFVILVACMIMLISGKLKLSWIIFAFICCSLVSFGYLCYALRCELAKPMIDWYDKAETNSHKNVSHCTLYGLLTGLITGIFAFKFFILAPKRAWFELVILTLVFAVYNVIILLKRQNYLLKQINR